MGSYVGSERDKAPGHVDMFEIGDGNTDDLGNIVRVFKSKIGRIKS